jgi:hypothetical protein
MRNSTEIPEGMTQWAGGDDAPADWDGGPVYVRLGPGDFEVHEFCPERFHWNYGNGPDIVGYTPKET